MNALRKLLNTGLAVLMVLMTVVTTTGGVQQVSAALPAVQVVGIVHTPPSAGLNIIAFPQRDFISASGYLASDVVQVSVIHPSGVSWTTNDVIPQDDPKAVAGAPFAGIVEVNHPGGACWPTTTPDIRPGDQVRITITANPETPGRVGQADETTVQNITAGRPVQTAPDTVQVHGTAVQADGVTPIPVGQVEQRMVANRDAFLLNGRRTLRATSAAGSDGSLSYDAANNPSGLNWTATYSGLDPADVTRALGAESRALWISPAIPATEGTIYENGAAAIPGPAAPCTAPLEKLPPPPGTETTPPSDPTGLTATVTSGNTVTLSWTASTDNVGVVDYGVYRDGIAIATVQNPDASAPAPATFVDRNVPPGAYTYTVDAGDAAGNRSNFSVGATVTATRPVATLPAGTTVNEPPVAPVQIISFPSRDFISSSGFLATDTVDVQLLRKEGGQLVLVSSATQIPQADPRAAPTDPFAGIVEVNHPGGACWDGTTPDIRVGDILRAIAYNPDGSIRTVEQTTTSNVVAQRPFVVKPATGTASDGIVAVHGTAMDANGNPIALGQIESRLIANRDLYDFNHRRVIRAGGAGKDGTFVYDTANNPTGVNWTATYSGLDADDVARAVGGTSPTTGRTFAGAESRILWLSATPAAAPEITIYENSDATVNGPSAPCTALGEPLDKAPPTFATTSAGLTATPVSGAAPNTNDVRLNWVAASDDVAVYGYRVYRDGQPLHNVGADTLTYLDKNVVGSHSYTVDATDAASPGPGGNAQGTPYGNRSAQSDPSSGPAVADVTPPSTPTNLVAQVPASGTTVTLTWSAATDNVGVAGYGIYRRPGGAGAWAKIADVTSGTTYSDASLTTNGAYEYAVDAVDAAGNRSAQSTSATANITGAADTAAPSVPTNFTATTPDVHVKNIVLKWAASTDNVGVTSYQIKRRQFNPSAAVQPAFVTIIEVNGGTLTYTDANVPAGTYDYTVEAKDSAGNSSGQSAPAQAVTANDPPTGTHSIIPFPARDFVSSTGYAVTEGPITISVLRKNAAGDWVTFASSTPISVVQDPATPGLGAVEVNHPGGGCWNTVTPNLVAGDVVRFVNKSGIADQTTIANVMADRPTVTKIDPLTGGGTVQVHGTAVQADGVTPIPVGQVESRLIANKDLFDFNGRRTLRAGGAGNDGTLAYDAVGSIKWTATYTLGTANDLARAAGGTSETGTAFVGAESRAMWLGRDPLALSELTTVENGAGVVGGPAGPACTAPAETPAAGAAITPAAGPTFAATAVGATSAAQTVTLTNNGTGSLHIDHAYIAGLNPGDFTITANGANGVTVAPGANITVSVAFKPTEAGQRQANLSFTDNAANTTDQTVPLVASTPAAAAAPTATAPLNSLAGGGFVTVAPTLTNSTIPVTLNWSGNGPAGTKYELQQKTGAGAFTTVTPAGFTGTAFTVNLVMGTFTNPGSYQFQVRACNSAGACGAWALGSQFTLAPVDDSLAGTVVYNGNWSTASPPAGAYGGTVHWTAGSGTATIANKVTFTITGNVAWVSTVGPDRGMAQVQVDGKTPQVVDLYQSTQQAGKVVWAVDGLVAGTTHTVTITVLGKASPLNPNLNTTCKTDPNKCARVDIDMAAWIK